jgi:hypothetical protein
MSLLGALVRTTVNLVTLPVALTCDAGKVVANLFDGENLNRGVKNTSQNLQRLKDEADD